MAKKRGVSLAPDTEIELTSLRTRRKVVCTVERLLGVGGTAKVFAGTLADGTHVVLKTQRYDERGADALLEIEIELFKKLFHRNIVHCVGAGTTAAGHLVLGFRRAYPNPLLLVSKSKVADQLRIDKKARYPSLPIDTAIDLCYELLNALAYLERLGFVHHDVKLANLLIDVDPKERPLDGHEVFGKVARRSYRGVLIDFGATRSRNYLEAWNRGEAAKGLSPQITPIYAPPEAVVEARREDGLLAYEFDPSLDVYAAALLIYAAFTGHPPYGHVRQQINHHDLESVIDIKSAERRGDIEAVCSDIIRRQVYMDAKFQGVDRAEFDLALYRFLARRVSPDPAQRGTALEMKREFERICRIKSARGGDSQAKLAAGGARVFLPFTQELVVVAPGAEHPLLRAARAHRDAERDEGAASGEGPPSAQAEAPPEVRAPSGEADPAAWGRQTREGPIPLAAADMAWLEDMDATGGARPASDPAGVGPAPGTWPGGAPTPRPAAERPGSDPRGRRRRPPPPPPPRPAADQVRPATPPPGGVDAARPPVGAAPTAPAGRSPVDPELLRRAGIRRRRRRPAGGRAASAPRPSPLERPDPTPAQAQSPHCLLSPVLDTPLLLSREQLYRIGRDPSVDVRIKSDLVSRRHAEVRWVERGFSVKDLGSLNGTTINGVRIQAPVILHDKDRIGFGGFEFVVRVLGDEHEVQQQHGTTTILRAGAEWAEGNTPAFAGELGQLALRDVVEIIDWKKHSGTLVVETPEGEVGEVHFREGRLIAAIAGELGPLDAAVHVLGQRRGKFSFQHGDPSCEATIDEDLQAVWRRVRPAG